ASEQRAGPRALLRDAPGQHRALTPLDERHREADEGPCQVELAELARAQLARHQRIDANCQRRDGELRGEQEGTVADHPALILTGIRAHRRPMRRSAAWIAALSFSASVATFGSSAMVSWLPGVSSSSSAP